MDSWLVAAALTSALLHAGWHAVVKSSPHPAEAMTAQMVGAGVLAIPVLLWTGLPAAASWPWLAGSVLLNIGAVSMLLRGYARGGYGVVYPIARASSVLVVLPLAAAIAGEWPAPLGLAGVALISIAVMMLALVNRNGARAVAPAVLGWTLGSAAFTAGYIVCDAQGVRAAGSPLAYGFAVSLVNGALWGWLQERGGMRLVPLFAAMWPKALALSSAAMVSYVLILWVWLHAPIALGSALRDTSAVFATVIALFVLKEPFDWRVVLAVALATAGSVLIRLG